MSKRTGLGPADLLDVRLRWQRLVEQQRDHDPGELRAVLLSNYTVDPLAPYLGNELATTRILVGPVNQIMQQCLDDNGSAARFAPDLLVVAPRLAEYLADGGLLVNAGRQLMDEVVAAKAAADRWNCCLLVVLSEVPETRRFGVGDDGSPEGTVAVAERARSDVRTWAAQRPNVYVVDMEQVVRNVGAVAAYAPGLYGHARIPYTETVFAELAARIGRILSVRNGKSCRAVVVDTHTVDGESLFWADVVTMLRELRSAGVRIAVRDTVSAGEFWARLDDLEADALDELVDVWLLGHGASTHAPDLARSLSVSASAVRVTRFDEESSVVDGLPVIGLGDDPCLWGTKLLAEGVFDRAHVVAGQFGPGVTEPSAYDAGTAAGATLESYVEALNVKVDPWPVAPGELPRVVEIVQRANDFTLGARPSVDEFAESLADPDSVVVLAAVRDRLGSYGPSAVLGFTFTDAQCVLRVFSVSCPVLGKGVEHRLLTYVADLALARGHTRLQVRCMDTGRNGVATRFLKTAASHTWGEQGNVAVEISPDGM
jgi:predicted enzyme involved in methoxymalonyl-ACP biosynthesis